MRADREIIQGRFDVIERNLQFLKEYQKTSPENFLKSYKDLQAAKFSLLEIIEASIDIANHIISINALSRVL